MSNLKKNRWLNSTKTVNPGSNYALWFSSKMTFFSQKTTLPDIIRPFPTKKAYKKPNSVEFGLKKVELVHGSWIRVCSKIEFDICNSKFEWIRPTAIKLLQLQIVITIGLAFVKMMFESSLFCDSNYIFSWW